MKRKNEAAVPEEVKSEIDRLTGNLLERVSELSSKHHVNLETLYDMVAEDLDGINVPDEESELIRVQAKAEGKTFSRWCLEAVIEHLAAYYFGKEPNPMPFRKEFADLY